MVLATQIHSIIRQGDPLATTPTFGNDNAKLGFNKVVAVIPILSTIDQTGDFNTATVDQGLGGSGSTNTSNIIQANGGTATVTQN